MDNLHSIPIHLILLKTYEIHTINTVKLVNTSGFVHFNKVLYKVNWPIIKTNGMTECYQVLSPQFPVVCVFYDKQIKLQVDSQ